jgi:hypothetical protein
MAAVCVVAAFVRPPALLALTIPVALLYHLEHGGREDDRILLHALDLLGRFIASHRR